MGKPNVILIIMDTVRADHLSCYGHRRETTPNIDRVAREGILFEKAFSAAPWTPPSHASVFSGTYPSRHRTLGRNIYLDESVESLPKVLSRNGYTTLGITCCPMLGFGSGFETGFAKYFDVSHAFTTALGEIKSKITGIMSRGFAESLIYGPDKGAYQANQIAKALIKREYIRKGRRSPFFLFINYFEAHTPYDPPRPFKEKFCEGFTEPQMHLKELLLRTMLGRTGETMTNPDLRIDKLQFIASGEGGFRYALRELLIKAEEWEVVKSWYDGEISYLDSRIGELLNFLRDNEIIGETLIIVTSDHGENFGEHGLAVHPLCVYDTLLHVPLIVSNPSLLPVSERSQEIVSTIDILPTILDMVDGDHRQKGLQGKTLFPPDHEKIHDFICAEYGGLHRKSMNAGEFYNEKFDEVDLGCKCIRSEKLKYIYTRGREELYDIQNDPLETANVVSKYRDKADFLRNHLEATIDASFYGPSRFPSRKETGEMERRLKALGYV